MAAMNTKATRRGTLGFKFDRSVLFLILANVFTLVVAVLDQWKLSEVLWVYWGQSVIIGFYNWRRIRCLGHFSTIGLVGKSSHRTPAPTKATLRENASFFAMHYGGFHLAYFSFLWERQITDLTRLGVFSVVSCLVLFALNSHVSFRRTLDRDNSSMPSLLGVMFFPYLRIVPMHLTVLLGAFGLHRVMPTTAIAATLTLVLFLTLKTAVDVLMHLIEHRDPFAVLPLTIHLAPVAEPPKAVRPTLAALAAHGFVTAGSWHLAEFPTFHVDLMVHPADGMLAAVDSASFIETVLTLHTLYPDERVVSFTNSPVRGPKANRPGCTVTQVPRADPGTLVSQARAERPPAPSLPVSAHDAPRVYERLYANEVLFRKAHDA